jgi:hypothetical protein
MDIKEGRYKARAIRGLEEYGESSNGTLQLTITLNVPALGRELKTFLYFSAASTPYSIERLRALGWKGDDFRNLDGIDANEVEVEVSSVPYEGKTQTRVQIVTSGTNRRAIDADSFAARVAALTAAKKE